MRFKNKVILITGSSSGIGLETSRLFEREGADLILTSRSDFEEEKNINKGKKVKIFFDQRRVESISKVASNIKLANKELDHCFFNTGIARFNLLHKTTEVEFDDIFNINFKSHFFLLQEILDIIKPGGSIIFTGSASWKMGLKGTSAYAASKAALYSIVKVLSNELASKNIRVNLISPGLIDSGIKYKTNLSTEKADIAFSILEKRIALERYGSVSDVANLVAFLCAEDSKYITGQEFVIDGGLTNN